MTNLELLKQLLESGQFHHATYRNLGTVWEGLWIYRKSNEGEGALRGFVLATAFNKSDPDTLEKAYELLRGTGISLGSYGKG